MAKKKETSQNLQEKLLHRFWRALDRQTIKNAEEAFYNSFALERNEEELPRLIEHMHQHAADLVKSADAQKPKHTSFTETDLARTAFALRHGEKELANSLGQFCIGEAAMLNETATDTAIRLSIEFNIVVTAKGVNGKRLTELFNNKITSLQENFEIKSSAILTKPITPLKKITFKKPSA